MLITQEMFWGVKISSLKINDDQQNFEKLSFFDLCMITSNYKYSY